MKGTVLNICRILPLLRLQEAACFTHTEQHTFGLYWAWLSPGNCSADALMSAGFQLFCFRTLWEIDLSWLQMNQWGNCRQESHTLGHESTVDTQEDLSGQRNGPVAFIIWGIIFLIFSLFLLHRSQMEEPSSRRSSPMMQCLIPITLTWRTTADVKTWCTNQQSGEPPHQLLLAYVMSPWNENFWPCSHVSWVFFYVPWLILTKIKTLYKKGIST